MSKAVHGLTTPSAREHTRRRFLCSAVPLAVLGVPAGELPTSDPSGLGPPSDEFLHYERCRRTLDAACEAAVAPCGSAELEVQEAVVHEAGDARYEAMLVIQRRPVRDWRSFQELVSVWRSELWDQGSDGTWTAHSCNEELEDAVARAVFKLIDGGLHA